MLLSSLGLLPSTSGSRAMPKGILVASTAFIHSISTTFHDHDICGFTPHGQGGRRGCGWYTWLQSGILAPKNVAVSKGRTRGHGAIFGGRFDQRVSVFFLASLRRTFSFFPGGWRYLPGKKARFLCRLPSKSLPPCSGWFNTGEVAETSH